jgi:hypothetical protein
MSMNKQLLFALAVGAAALPALATPVPPLPPLDNGLTTTVPRFGISRVETVSMCLTDAGVQRYQDLITDMQFDTFSACMHSNT